MILSWGLARSALRDAQQNYNHAHTSLERECRAELAPERASDPTAYGFMRGESAADWPRCVPRQPVKRSNKLRSGPGSFIGRIRPYRLRLEKESSIQTVLPMRSGLLDQKVGFSIVGAPDS
jgi:hypothetical protein